MIDNRGFTWFDRLIAWIDKYYRFLFAFVMGLVIFLCFYRLSNPYVVSWDEARFGINAYEMLKSGNFIMNTFTYEPDYWNLKPPLSMYGTAVSFLIFGYNKLGLRAFGAFCYVVLTAVCSVFLKKRYGSLASLLAMAFLCANNACFAFHMIRSGDSDSLYVLFFTLSMLCMLLIDEHPRSLYGAGLFFAAAFLTKSWHAGAIVVIGFLYLLLSGEFRQMKPKRFLLFLASFLVPIGIWALLRTTQDGIVFFREMVFYELLTSSTEAIENHENEFFFYFRNYFKDNWRIYIYTAALVIDIAGLAAISFEDGGAVWKERNKRNRVIGILLWFLVPISAFSIAATKLIWYSYASLIPLLLGAGLICAHFLEKKQIPSAVRMALLLCLVVLLGYYIHANTVTIRSQHDNDYHDFFYEATAADDSHKGEHIYLGASGDFGYGAFSQNTTFIAETSGDYICRDGGVEEFVRDPESAVIMITGEYYEQYRDLLQNAQVLYDNGKYYFLWNGVR